MKSKKKQKGPAYDMFVSLMAKAGYPSLTQFADAIGEPKSSLSRYFNGSRQLPADTLCKVAYELKTTPNKILVGLGYSVRAK